MKKIALLSISFFGFFLLKGAIHTVVNTNDSGAGSLRQAIIDANADIGPTRTIRFSIGTGIQTIQPLSDLPLITVSDTLIDGTSQPGWSTGNPIIILDGSLLPAPAVATGLLTLSGTDNCVIQSLVLNNYSSGNQALGILITDTGDVIGANNNAVYGCFVGTDQTGTIAQPNHNGIRINAFTDDSSNNNIIGGATIDQRNILSGNVNGGLVLLKNVNGTIIRGNYFGLDKSGKTALPNGSFGIGVFGSLTPLPQEKCIGTIIGGSATGQRNIIAGHTVPGVGGIGIVLFFNCFNTIIENNFIGVDVTGRAVIPNDYGIYCFGTVSPSNAPIDSTLIQNNVISGNTADGIYLQSNVNNSIIKQNQIGTDQAEMLALGNGFGGILIQGEMDAPCINNLVGGTGSLDGNTIVNNGNNSPPGYGVLIQGAASAPFILLPILKSQSRGPSATVSILNPILQNSIFNNNNNGIELEAGGNDMQPSPTITGAHLCLPQNTITISAFAPATPIASHFRLEFFINTIDRAPITEGQRFIGTINSVPAGGAVTGIFAVPAPAIPVQSWISATATNLNNTDATPGDTSQFSTNVQVTSFSPEDVLLTASETTICPGQTTILTTTISGMAPFTVIWSDGFVQTHVVSPVTRIVNPVSSTSYSVEVTEADGCTTSSLAPIFINVNNVLKPIITDILINSGQTVTLNGQAQPFAAITIFENNSLIGSSQANSQGTFSVTTTELNLGINQLVVTATLSNGCSESTTITVFVGSGFIDLTIPSCSLIRTNHPRIAGKTVPDGLVRLEANGIILGMVSADTEGNFSFVSPTALPNGNYIITASLIQEGIVTVSASKAITIQVAPLSVLSAAIMEKYCPCD